MVGIACPSEVINEFVVRKCSELSPEGERRVKLPCLNPVGRPII
jgi:hypothetical protein